MPLSSPWKIYQQSLIEMTEDPHSSTRKEPQTQQHKIKWTPDYELPAKITSINIISSYLLL